MHHQTILITGGAGYIGSHAALQLAHEGYRVVIVDSLVHGQLFSHPWATFIHADISDSVRLESIIKQYKVDAVMHFAAFIEVGESVRKPHEFYTNNVVNTLSLLDVMRRCNVRRFIFSSSCAVYGNPVRVPIDEGHPFDPISPYGRNKLVVEYALRDYARAYGLEYVSLRYFNAAGAFPEHNLGEFHRPETHAIPLLLRALRFKQPFALYGEDYTTPDGSCIRDYIHVRDIADAHVRALHHLEKTKFSDVFNLGTGRGFSVKELISAAEHVCHTQALIKRETRREGDVDILVADPSKAARILHWKPKFSELSFILRSALRFEERMDVVRPSVIDESVA